MVLWLFVRFGWGFGRAAGVRWGFVHALQLACLLGFLRLVKINKKYRRKLSTICGLGLLSSQLQDATPTNQLNPTMKTTKEIKLKDGSTLPKGLAVMFTEEKPTRCLVHSPLHCSPLQVRVSSAFKAPSMSSLERWNDDGGCKTPTGKWTECDGYGSDGSPSWMLALGLI